MSQRYQLTPSAQGDVDRIVDVIAADNVEAALRVHDALEHAFQHVAEMPAIGHGILARARSSDQDEAYTTVERPS